MIFKCLFHDNIIFIKKKIPSFFSKVMTSLALILFFFSLEDKRAETSTTVSLYLKQTFHMEKSL